MFQCPFGCPSDTARLQRDRVGVKEPAGTTLNGVQGRPADGAFAGSLRSDASWVVAGGGGRTWKAHRRSETQVTVRA